MTRTGHPAGTAPLDAARHRGALARYVLAAPCARMADGGAVIAAVTAAALESRLGAT